MTDERINRITFHSVNDLTVNQNLKEAEKLLSSLDLSKNFNANDLIELYNIKLFFENNLYLPSWENETKINFNDLINKSWELNRSYFIKLDNDSILGTIDVLHTSYKSSFWKLLDYFQAYNNISNDVFMLILKDFPNHIYNILLYKNIVNKFHQEVRDFLLEYESSAALLLSNVDSAKYFFPKSLNSADIENIYSKYIESEEPNLNYVKSIEQLKDTKDFKLKPKTRLKAKKKVIELNNEIFEKGNHMKFGVQVSISIEQNEPLEVESNDLILSYTYSKKFFDKFKQKVDFLNVFKFLFFFIDDKGIVNLINKESELLILEKVLSKSNGVYNIGISFQRKQMLSDMQIHLLNQYLIRSSDTVEKLIERYIQKYLNPFFGLNNLRFNFPTLESTFLEKIRVLAPEFEFLLRQFQLYVDEKEIDFELLELNSTPLNFSDIKSLASKKYIYGDSNKVMQLKHYFHSDQSVLFYVDPYKGKYHSFYELLKNEKVEYINYEDYQKNEINQLVHYNYIFIDENNYVKMKNQEMIYVIGELHKKDVISYWHYDENIRKIIDELIDEKTLHSEGAFYSKQEINYFNYYLNKKEYTNGLDLRNKYIHGTNSSSEIEQKNDYYRLLKLIILTLLKIEDDLNINKQFK